METQTPFPKRQHYVPRLLLRRFANRSGQLWVFDKRRGGAPKLVSIDKAFVENHIYTIKDERGAPYADVEHILGEIETRAAPIIDRLIDCTRRQIAPRLTEEETFSVWSFVTFQYRRVPDFFRNVKLPGTPHEMIENALERIAQELGRSISNADRAALLEPEDVKRRFQRIRMESLVRHTPVLNIFMMRGMMLGRLADPRRAFVLGSFPFARFQHDGRVDLTHPWMELWMPLAPDVAIASYGSRGRPELFSIDQMRQVRTLNNEIFAGSTVVASASQDLIKSLSRKHNRSAQKRPVQPDGFPGS